MSAPSAWLAAGIVVVLAACSPADERGVDVRGEQVERSETRSSTTATTTAPATTAPAATVPPTAVPAAPATSSPTSVESPLPTPTTGLVRGLVQDADGSPCISRVDLSGPLGTVSTQTGPDGGYAFADLIPGDYAAIVTTERGDPADPMIGTAVRSTRTPIAVVPGEQQVDLPSGW